VAAGEAYLVPTRIYYASAKFKTFLAKNPMVQMAGGVDAYLAHARRVDQTEHSAVCPGCIRLFRDGEESGAKHDKPAGSETMGGRSYERVKGVLRKVAPDALSGSGAPKAGPPVDMLAGVFGGMLSGWTESGIAARVTVPELVHADSKKRGEAFESVKKALEMSVNILPKDILAQYSAMLAEAAQCALDDPDIRDAAPRISELMNTIRPYMA
jgi:hypothetical protein